MKSLLKDESGNFAQIMPMALAICIIMVMIIILLNGQIHSQFMEAEIFLERASNVAVDQTKADVNIRDVVLSIDYANAKSKFENILVNTNGFVKNGDSYVKKNNNKISYVLQNIVTYVENIEDTAQRFVVTGQISMRLPFNVGVPLMTNPINITAKSQILYKDLS